MAQLLLRHSTDLCRTIPAPWVTSECRRANVLRGILKHTLADEWREHSKGYLLSRILEPSVAS